VQLTVSDAAIIRNQDRTVSIATDRFVKQQRKVDSFAVSLNILKSI
jgi:hypothetical protein